MSTSRRCDFTKCNDGKWYLTLGDFEYAEEEADCTTYGPFDSLEGANKELDNHSNPGSSCTDDSGHADPPPKEALTTPTSRRSYGGVGRFRY